MPNYWSFTFSFSISLSNEYSGLISVRSLIYGPNIPGSYAILFFTALVFHHQTHPQLNVISALSQLLHSLWSYSPVTYWTPSNLGGSCSTVISFCLSILFIRFLWQEHESGLPFLSLVDHVLSELFTMTQPSWVALGSRVTQAP